MDRYCFGYCYYCWVLLRSPAVSSPTLTLKRMTKTNLEVVSHCPCSCHLRCHGFESPLDAVAECLLGDRASLDCPMEIRPASCTRSQDHKQVRKGTAQRTDCGGGDCTRKDAPEGTVVRDALLSQAFLPLVQSFEVAVASGGVGGLAVTLPVGTDGWVAVIADQIDYTSFCSTG